MVRKFYSFIFLVGTCFFVKLVFTKLCLCQLTEMSLVFQKWFDHPSWDRSVSVIIIVRVVIQFTLRNWLMELTLYCPSVLRACGPLIVTRIALTVVPCSWNVHLMENSWIISIRIILRYPKLVLVFSTLRSHCDILFPLASHKHSWSERDSNLGHEASSLRLWNKTYRLALLMNYFQEVIRRPIPRILLGISWILLQSSSNLSFPNEQLLLSDDPY